MIPKSIKKFLTKCWGYDESDITEEKIEYDHYITWYCGIDHIVDRDKTPDKVIIIREFSTYTFNDSIKKSEDVAIKYNENTRFFYNYLRDFIKNYYEKKPFNMRIIRIQNGFFYLEFLLDEKYSFIFQMIYEVSDDEMKKLSELKMTKEKPKDVKFDDIFKSLNITSDMIL